CDFAHSSTFCSTTASTKAGTAHVAYENARRTTSTADPERVAPIVPSSRLKTTTKVIARPSSTAVCPTLGQNERKKLPSIPQTVSKLPPLGTRFSQSQLRIDASWTLPASGGAATFVG